MGENSIVPFDEGRMIQDCVFTILDVQVMLDHDLAAIHQVSTSAFNQAIKRNIDYLPPMFRFQLTQEEDSLMSQIMISKRKAGEELRGGYHKTC